MPQYEILTPDDGLEYELWHMGFNKHQRERIATVAHESNISAIKLGELARISGSKLSDLIMASKEIERNSKCHNPSQSRPSQEPF